MRKEIPKVVARRIGELRKGKGWSKAELARRLGVHEDMPGHYEKARRTPSLEVLARVASVFGVSTDYLLGLTDER